MDTIPVQQIPSQQVQAQPISPQPAPVQNPPQKTNLRKIFNISSWIFLFALLPVTVLIFLSQNTVPGDLFYPVKRSLENVILAAASVSPATKAAFRTDLTTRRFDEAEKLLLASSTNNGLQEFVTGIGAAQNEVSAISDPIKKQELQQKIETSVAEYEKRLDSVKTQLVTREQATQLALAPTSSPEIQPTTIPLPTNIPVSLPTSTAKTPIPPKSPTPTPTREITVLITVTPIPSFAPTPTPTPPPTKERETIGTVDTIQDFLHCLKKTPPPHKECKPPEIKSERRSEEKSKQEEKTGENKQEKEKTSSPNSQK